MASKGTADFFFVDVKAEDKKGSITRGTKISHALKRHHREARRERAKKQLASRYLVSGSQDDGGKLPLRTRSLSSSGRPLDRSSPLRQSRQGQEQRACGIEILRPLALHVVLGQGRLDPFNIYPAENISLYVHEVLDHAVNHTWPGVSPFGRLSSNPVKRAWLGCAMSNPVAFYSFVFAAALHHAYKHGWDSISNTAYELMFSYKTKAISLVNEALQNIDIEISDALLVSILILAAHGPRSSTVGDNSSAEHPLSLLSKVQNIDFYGSLRFDGLHMNALRLLIARRGGLQTIKLYGLAETIAFGEILGASETFTQPSLPEFFSCPTSIITSVSDPDVFASLQTRVILKDLLSVLHDMSAICKALNVLQDGKADPVLLNDLIRTRNTVQHRLLSLPPRGFILVLDHGIYEVCRLAALIFSDMVIYPLPATTNVRPRLSSMLRQTLQKLPIGAEKTNHAQVLLWVVMLGAIAAAKIEGHQSWYRVLLRQYSVLLGIGQWSEVQAIMKKHLWFDSVCDSPARRIWAEVTDHD